MPVRPGAGDVQAASDVESALRERDGLPAEGRRKGDRILAGNGICQRDGFALRKIPWRVVAIDDVGVGIDDERLPLGRADIDRAAGEARKGSAAAATPANCGSSA